MYAGIDWTGLPDLKQTGFTVNLFGVACVVVFDIEAINARLAALRLQWVLPGTLEFHGHELTEAQLLYFARWFAAEADEEVRVFAFLFDKKELVINTLLVDKPASLYPASARLVIASVLDLLPLKRIWLDNDIPKPKQEAFDSAVKREARLRRKGTRINVKHRASDTSSLIQLADVAAYLVQRHERGSFQSVLLDEQVRAMWRARKNGICWGKEGDLRPYI